MKLSDFDFFVPERLIAQVPTHNRDGARMLVYSRHAQKIEHKKFIDLPQYLSKCDHLVFNSSKVVKARLIGERETKGRIEIFILEWKDKSTALALVKATASRKTGITVRFKNSLEAMIGAETNTPMVYEVFFSSKDGKLHEVLEEVATIPLPPYIQREAESIDLDRYQTIYAETPGSVAAPTAGLHFTQDVLNKIGDVGASIHNITLHVGLGTFQPIKVADIADHKMHRERFLVPDLIKTICKNKESASQRIVAVGTTSVRALESSARNIEEATDLFLKPGEKFLWVDSIFTNFHQPKSSLAVMMSAFLGGSDVLRSIYDEAVKEEYRFFSYGDCMLVI